LEWQDTDTPMGIRFKGGKLNMADKWFVITIRVDGRNLETKPFKAKSREDAIFMAENGAKINFPDAEDIDAVNSEEMDEDEYILLYCKDHNQNTERRQENEKQTNNTNTNQQE